jgi:serine/threonine-protein kinase
MAELSPGAAVGGRYELGRQLGAGGMARVYLAHDNLLDREVAVKVLSDRYAADPAFVERFRREASAAAALNHPNIVSVYDRGEADGSYYIVMEYLEGPDLKQVIRRRAPLPPAEAVDYALQILAALGAAHRRHVIHRDVKPQNVMVAEDGRLKVTDFGIARAGAGTTMTEAGAVIGTAQYLSPEQARGAEVTAASDCYSVGIVLYEMLTGRVPFDGERPVVVAMKQITEPPVPPRDLVPEIPRDLSDVVMRALEKRPSDRFESADEFSQALLEVREHLPGGDTATRLLAMGGSTRVMPAGPPTAPTRLGPVAPPPKEPPRRRRRGPIIAAVAVLLAVVAGLAAFLLLRSSNNTVTVPHVAGLTTADARSTLTSAGLHSDTRAATSSDVAPGIVIRSAPAGGSDVAKNSLVTLVVSSGPELATLPDVTGSPVDNATAQLQSAGFKVHVAGAQSSDTVSSGNVISQDPSAGRVARGATVTLTPSSGPKQVTVPSVRGTSLEVAQARIQSAGLTVGSVDTRETDKQSPNTVLEQSPGATATVDKGSRVDLVVASAPARVSAPNVIGDTPEQARATLVSAGFPPPTSETAPSGAIAGTVFRQQPAAGTMVPRNQQFVISVSTGSAVTTGGSQPPPPSGTSGGSVTSP